MKSHWEDVYRTKRPDQVSWYRPHLETSLQLIEQALPGRRGRIIDVGGGESTLVDDLLKAGYEDIDVLDISATALKVAQERLGQRAKGVHWLSGDVTNYPFEPTSFDLWHDRAVFHFLTDTDDRAAYVRQVARSVRPGGHVIVATFGPHGPTRCSGLEVVRYSPDALHAEFGVKFELVKHLVELHRTPRGVDQQFVYCLCNVASEADVGAR
jgi:SAM-dependent methyltransferase